MIKQNDHKLSNFWIGFSFGICAATGLAYMFGTQKGRDMTKKMLRFSENLEENIARLIERAEKQKTKKDGKKSLFQLEDVEGILTKIKQVTNHS